MLRACLGALLALALSGCWMSEERLFGAADWSPPPGIAGTYTSENGSGDAQAQVVLSMTPEGLVQGVATKVGEETSETSLIGFVSVPGGSGKYYLLVDRTKDGAESQGDLYFIARTTNEGFEAFWPQCAGTTDGPGMLRDRTELIDEEVCGFTTRDAVLRAGLEAEQFLSAKHIVDIPPMGRMKRIDPEDAAYEDVDGGEDFTEADPFFE